MREVIDCSSSKPSGIVSIDDIIVMTNSIHDFHQNVTEWCRKALSRSKFLLEVNVVMKVGTLFVKVSLLRLKLTKLKQKWKSFQKMVVVAILAVISKNFRSYVC